METTITRYERLAAQYRAEGNAVAAERMEFAASNARQIEQEAAQPARVAVTPGVTVHHKIDARVFDALQIDRWEQHGAEARGLLLRWLYRPATWGKGNRARRRAAQLAARAVTTCEHGNEHCLRCFHGI